MVQDLSFNFQQECLEGRFLIASSILDDSCFAKSIIYICAHDAEGAIGVIVNQPIGVLDVNKTLKDQKKSTKSSFAKKQYPLMFGGPVNSDQIVVLSINEEQKEHFEEDQRLTFHANVESFFNSYINSKSKDKFLVAKGITAWDSSQLEAEIEENAWIVSKASYDIIFSQKIKKKWDYIIKKMGLSNLNNLVNYSGHA